MAQIFYYEIDDFLKKEDRYKLLENAKNVYGVEWKEMAPDKNNVWLTEGMEDDWEGMISIGNKESKQLIGNSGQGSENIKAIFGLYSSGVKTNRDSWVYNSNKSNLINKISTSIDIYNHHVIKFSLNKDLTKDLDNNVLYDEDKISWDSNMKNHLARFKYANFEINKIRYSIYRPFYNQFLFYDRIFNNTYSLFYKIYPNPDSEKENLVICVSGVGSSKQFQLLIINLIPSFDFIEKGQCFPFYTYDEDGSNRKENISDWALKEFQKRYSVVSGQRSENNNFDKNNEVLDGENNNLQGFGSMAEGNGPGGDDLSDNREISKKGDVWIGESNSKSSNISSIQYSRRTSEKHNKGIHTISENCEGFNSGVGNAIDNNSSSKLSNERRNDSNLGIDSDNRKTSQWSDTLVESKNIQTLSTNHQPPITKWDIFYYIYGVLHKPEYRAKYPANLRRELPRIPFYDDFWKYSEAGRKLAELHLNYETQEEYYLEKIESPGKQLDYKVEKMKYNKDKTAIIYNDFLTLSGIPAQTHDYKLGNRSALDWIIDQYQVKTDKRSSITNDPNRLDEPDYIIKLIGKIITVSLETVKIVNSL